MPTGQTHFVQSQVLAFVPDKPDGAVHITAPKGQQLNIDADSTQITNKLRAGNVGLFNIVDRADNNLVSIPTGTANRFEFDASCIVDFNNCGIEGFTGAGSGGGSIPTTTQIASQNGYANLEAELDAMHVKANRTTSITSTRLARFNGAGELTAGAFDESQVVRKNDVNDQAVLGGLDIGAGKIYQVNGNQISTADLSNGSAVVLRPLTSETFSGTVSANKVNVSGLLAQYQVNGSQIDTGHLSDGADITKDNVVNTATTTALALKMNADFSNIGATEIPDANIPASIARDGEVCALTGNQTIAGDKTFSNTVIKNGGTNIRDPGMTGSEAWSIFSTHPANHKLVWGFINSSGTFFDHFDIEAETRIRSHYDIQGDGHMNLVGSGEYQQNGTKISTTALSDGSVIAKTNDASLSAFAGNLNTAGALTTQAGILNLDATASNSIQVDGTSNDTTFTTASGQNLDFVNGSAIRLRMSSTESVFTGDVYASGNLSTGTKLQTANDVNTILGSTATATNVKLNIIEGSAAVGFSGLSDFTTNHLNPIRITASQHRPVGAPPVWTAIPSPNTFNCDCASSFTGNTTISGTLFTVASTTSTFTNALTCNSNLTVDGSATLGNTSGDTHTVNGAMTFNDLPVFASGIDCNGDHTVSGVCNVQNKITGNNGLQITAGSTQFDGATIMMDDVAYYGDITTSMNFAPGNDITRTDNGTEQNYLDRVKELFTSYHKTVTLQAGTFVQNGSVKLFDTDDTFDVYEFGVRKGTTTIDLSDTDFQKSAFKVLLSFQGYTSASAGSAYLFDYNGGSGGIHSSFKLMTETIGYNVVSANDGSAPNTLVLPSVASYHITGMETPTVQWQAPSGAPHNINLIFGNTAISGTITGSTTVFVKLVKIADFI